jgi:hypothetical protein
MIGVVILVAILGVLIGATAATSRIVARYMASQHRGRSIDQDLVEGRLIRIEEAIDAMALQIERLTEHQRQALGGREPSLPREDPQRTEHPR